jgi:poly(3-hydroxybutyrate) depolymerase
LYLHLATGDGDHQVMLDGFRPYLDDLDGLMVMMNTAGGARQESEIVSSLVDQISSEYCVDPQRVHAMGTGPSFGMTERLTCGYPDMVASFAASSGTGSGGCTPLQPVPLLTFTGDQDRSGVEALLERWVAVSGCDPEPVERRMGCRMP